MHTPFSLWSFTVSLRHTHTLLLRLWLSAKEDPAFRNRMRASSVKTRNAFNRPVPVCAPHFFSQRTLTLTTTCAVVYSSPGKRGRWERERLPRLFSRAPVTPRLRVQRAGQAPRLPTMCAEAGNYSSEEKAVCCWGRRLVCGELPRSD